MDRKLLATCALNILVLAVLLAAPTQAVVPGDRLMPPATRGFASITDVRLLTEHWHQTQFGQLVQDEAMKPFIADLQRQLERKISGVRDKLGIKITDLREVAGGEIAFGLAEREGSRAAVLLTVDATGHRGKLETLLAKVDKELASRNARRETATVAGAEFVVYTIPVGIEGQDARTAVYFVKDDMLCASDNREEAEALLRRFDGQSTSLATTMPYLKTMTRCAAESVGLVPEVRWFVDPFGYGRTVRSLSSGDQVRRGKDYLAILESQGFDAIQGIGGHINLMVGGSYEILHRTSVFAPPLAGETDKYRLAMRMMSFPNASDLSPAAWMPRQMASYRTFSCDLQNAFANFGSLFDTIVGNVDSFDLAMKGFEDDPYGPQINVANDFIKHLGQRVVLVSDHQMPITPESEQMLAVIDVLNEQAIAATLEKIMLHEPNAVKVQYGNIEVWEIQEPNEDSYDIDLSSADLDLLDAGPAPGAAAAKAQAEAISSAVCVHGGRLYIASHAEFLKKILASDPAGRGLATAIDYREVEASLDRLVKGPVAARTFVRTDEAYRPVYELLRQSKMPQSQSMLGKILNRVLTSPEDEDEGILREQKIDGRKLPSFEMVRRYFGPAGAVVRSEADGWFLVGATLGKLTPQARATSHVAEEALKLR